MTMRNSAITTITPRMIQPVRLIGASPRASNDGRAIYQCRGGNENPVCGQTQLRDRHAHDPLIPGPAAGRPIDPFLIAADQRRHTARDRVDESDWLAARRGN